ncbi:MAG: hypothetical protein ACJAUP_002181 [Cellvibrionaceae bacterium]
MDFQQAVLLSSLSKDDQLTVSIEAFAAAALPGLSEQ